MSEEALSAADLRLCYEGAVPAVIATASAYGVPNVTYLSRVRYVDDEHVALSNQFFSKTARNLAENPRASMLLIDPTTFDEFRLSLVFERTVTKGPVFQKLREDVDEAAAHHGMQDVFKLRAADLFRVLDIERARTRTREPPDPTRGPCPAARWPRRAHCPAQPLSGPRHARQRNRRRSRRAARAIEHSLLMLLDEDGSRLFTIASHGYPSRGRRVRGARGRGHDRHGGGSLVADARRQPPADAQVLDDGAAGVRGGGRRRARARVPLPAWSAPRAAWRCRRWRWASSSAC